MNESFVFKNKKGARCGYIMARGKQLRIRLPEGMEKSCLTAVYEDGERNFEGGFDGYETERPNDGGRLIGAYVTADGKMVLDTGTAARKAFENRKATACRPEKQTQKPETAERRWPPPPCMPGAVYRKGIWEVTKREVR